MVDKNKLQIYPSKCSKLHVLNLIIWYSPLKNTKNNILTHSLENKDILYCKENYILSQKV